ncbi:hypothetical protein A1359_02280 [Methylomonas lenta]|uniref:Uncharacterized protein n=1 Tax=Methylomonas lenta TaxID=980561 RepID=A0A177NTL9_9GAMM|nr:hypothetical protein [Methylomonas lenta]OAI21335.1 hypothetical protein A1359_02280 [Methylomonas lenta]
MMIRRISLPVRLAVLVLWLPACADLQPFSEPIKLDSTRCERFFQAIDKQFDEYGVGDAGAAKISGFAGLRVDRFLASFAQQNLTTDAYAAWLNRLQKLDETARLIEWRNLPDKAKSRLQSSVTGDVEVAIHSCGQILAQQVQNSPSQRARLLTELQSPEAYSTWQRLFGLYYLTRWAIVDGVRQLHQEMQAPFLHNDQAVDGQLIHYVPPTSPAIQAADVAAILEQSAANPLAIPEPSTDQLDQLFAAFAPAWLVDTLSDNDRIGMVNITGDGDAYINTQKPIVYRLPSHTRFGKQILLQLNYMVWFTARPPDGLLDIYAGRFDGLIWRVTLKMDGQPLVYDSIHPCGCYYQIFPAETVRVVQPEDGSEPILTPTSILAHQPGERLLVKIAAGNHFITGIATQQPEPGAIVKKYGWLAYDALRSLPMPNGGYQSLFDQDGLMPGSERSERFLLWPMGVPSAGAMRQWGTHAIAFLGKRHFDDPWLLDKLLRPLWE